MRIISAKFNKAVIIPADKYIDLFIPLSWSSPQPGLLGVVNDDVVWSISVSVKKNSLYLQSVFCCNERKVHRQLSFDYK